MRAFRIDADSPSRRVLGVGGVGTGIFFALEGDHTLGRSESRPGRLLDVKDYCKLHIVSHYIAKLLSARPSGSPFHVVPIAKVGNDAAGRDMLRAMREVGMDTHFVQSISGQPTLFSVCFQYPDGTGGNITTSNSAAATLCDHDLDAPMELARTGGTIALCLPEVPMQVRERFLHLAKAAGAFCAASFVSAEVKHARDCGMIERLDLLAVNENEAAELIGCPISFANPKPLVDRCLSLVHDSYPNLQLVVTGGAGGAYAFANGVFNYCAAPKVAVVSTAGAGDALLGALLAAVAAGIPVTKPGIRRKDLRDRPIETGLELAVLLGSYKVSSCHTIHPDASLSSLVEFATKLGVTFAPELGQFFCDQQGSPQAGGQGPEMSGVVEAQ